MSVYNFVRSGRNFTIFFVQRTKDPSRQFQFVAIFIDFKDVCAQSQKLS